ncbi:tol-pal system protein YbgF [Desulfobacterales bacterium HSG16]|nr:tol-pal system protein YbgF [Desulfobacterales bacterium HSG16]
MRAIVLFLPCIFFLTCFAGCATQENLDALYSHIIQLEQQNKELQKKNATAVKERQRIYSELRDYSKNRSEKDQKFTSQSAGLSATFEKIREDIQRLNGKIEENGHRIGIVGGTVKTLEQTNEKRLKKLEQYLNFEGPGAAQGGRFTPGSSSSTSKKKTKDKNETTLSDKELYELARKAYNEGDDQRAMDGFSLLEKEYPRSQYADNAKYWIGQIYYRKLDYKQAILNYQEVIEKYPNGNKAPAAMLQQAYSFFNLGKKQHARILLQDLIKKYPNSEDAREAKKKLGMLK